MKTYRIILLLLLGFCSIALYSHVTVYPKGVTIYKPELCYNGYTLFTEAFKIKLMDMNGNVVHEWDQDVIKKSDLLYSPLDSLGRLLLIIPSIPPPDDLNELGNKPIPDVRKGLFDNSMTIDLISWDSKLLWESDSGLYIHHDVQFTSSGNMLTICNEFVPDDYMDKVKSPERRAIKLISDKIIEISPDGAVVWEWHAYEHLDLNDYLKCHLLWDWTHINSASELPHNDLEAKDQRFRAGNIMICIRNLNLIAIIDKATKEIVWSWGKNFLDQPHGTSMSPDGNILVFNNGLFAPDYLANISTVYEIDPIKQEIVWYYFDLYFFSSTIEGSAQKLPNGNVLISETTLWRIFEVTRDKEVVWEYVSDRSKGGACGSYRAFRIPYDCCQQTKALPKPQEKPVIPDIPYLEKPLENPATSWELLQSFKKTKK